MPSGGFLRTRSSSGCLRPSGTCPEVVESAPNGFFIGSPKYTPSRTWQRRVQVETRHALVQPPETSPSSRIRLKPLEEHRRHSPGKRKKQASRLPQFTFNSRMPFRRSGDLEPAQPDKLVTDPGGLFVILATPIGRSSCCWSRSKRPARTVVLDVALQRIKKPSSMHSAPWSDWSCRLRKSRGFPDSVRRSG